MRGERQVRAGNVSQAARTPNERKCQQFSLFSAEGLHMPPQEPHLSACCFQNPFPPHPQRAPSLASLSPCPMHTAHLQPPRGCQGLSLRSGTSCSKRRTACDSAVLLCSCTPSLPFSDCLHCWSNSEWLFYDNTAVIVLRHAPSLSRRSFTKQSACVTVL